MTRLMKSLGDGIVELRSRYIDNLRLLVIVLVVLVHAAVTYSGIGNWYYKETGRLTLTEMLLFLFFQSFTQSYFMGLLFLLAGYMVPCALKKKGPRLFLHDRLVRLGCPTLFYMLLLNPAILYSLSDQHQMPPLDFLASYYLGLRFVGGSGPLWFALALLIFTVIYTAVQRGPVMATGRDISRLYGMQDLLGLSLLITGCTFLVRLVQPLDSSILNMQLCYFSQYIVFFSVGTIAGRKRLFDSCDYRLGVRCLQIALFPGTVFWGLLLVFGGGLFSGSIDVFKGGMHWQSFAYAFWESVNGVFVSYGLIAVFKERWNRQSAFVRLLTDASFSVYVFHAPLLIAIAISVQSWRAIPFIKFLGVGVAALVISFGLAHLLLKRVPLFYTIKPSVGRRTM